MKVVNKMEIYRYESSNTRSYQQQGAVRALQPLSIFFADHTL